CDLMKWQLSMDAKFAFGFAGSEALRSARGKATFEVRQRCGRQRKPDRKGMAAKSGEQVGAGFDGGEQRETVNGTAGAMGDSVFNGDDESRFGGAFDDARGEDSNYASVPAVAIHNEQTAFGELRVCGKARFDCGQCTCLSFAAFAIEALKLAGKLVGTRRIA